ncbi:MAG: hypothetical protein ACRCTZ_08210 [Sarcina sp.]
MNECSNCKYNGLNGCMLNINLEDCHAFGEKYEELEIGIDRSEKVIQGVYKPSELYKPSPKAVLNVFGNDIEIYEHIKLFEKTGEINGIKVSSKYKDAYSKILWIKYFDSIDKDEIKEYNNAIAFRYVIDGRDSLFTDDVKELCTMLKKK